MAYYRRTEDLLRRLRQLELISLGDLQIMSGLTPGSTRALAAKLVRDGRLDALPIRGIYAWPGWRDRPGGEFIIFKAWLRKHNKQGCISADELRRFENPKFASSTERWRIEIISTHAEPVLAKHYQVKRVSKLPRGMDMTNFGVPLARR